MLQGLDMSSNLVTSLAPTKFYKSQNQYLLTDNVPTLEADASLLDLSNKGRYAIPIKQLGSMGKESSQTHSSQFPCRLVFICSIFMPPTRIDVGCGPFKTSWGRSKIDQTRYSYVHHINNRNIPS